MANSRRLLYILGVAFAAAAALGLRWRAVTMLPIDYDEDDYLRAGQIYAAGFARGEWAIVTRENYRFEHPALAKLMYGVVFALARLPVDSIVVDVPIVAAPANSLPEPFLTGGRSTSAVIGALQVLALALLNPLAGLFLAIHTWQIKYTSQIMLDALPSFFGVLAVLLYVRSQSNWNAWLILSAGAAGLAMASKYLHAVVAVAIIADYSRVMYNRRPPAGWGDAGRWLGPIAAWGTVVALAFFLADPYLWPDPAGRLLESAGAVTFTTTNSNVESANFPFWQPLVWLSGPVPWHAGVFVLALDLYISVLAVLGFPRLWRRHRVFALWLVIALALLLVWRTKWPQYILVLTAPLCLAAAEGFSERVWEPLSGRLRRRRSGRLPAAGERESAPDTRRAIPWLVPGLIGLLLLTIFPLVCQFAMSLTDFNALSIKDGISGGVWREVWLGLTFQRTPRALELFSRPSGSSAVHFAGPGLLLQLFFGLGSNVLFFNVMWSALSVALQAALGVSAALMLDRTGVRFRNGWRVIFILPWAIPEFVGALIWLRIFEPDYGWLTQSLPADVVLPRFFDDPNFALICLLIAATWHGFPLIMLAATAGLKLAPREVYDAAAMDGAGLWAQLRYITFPLLWPLLAPAIIIRSIFAFNQFYLFWVMQSPFPLTTFATVSYFMFSSFGGGQYAVSAAINIFTVVVLIGLILWFNRVSKVGEGVTYA